jgi:Protein of unknown function (DUF2786)
MAPSMNLVEGIIEAINDRDVKVAGEWRNVSKFHPVDLPDRGARVRILLDTKGFIRTPQILDAAPSSPSSPSSTSASSPNRDREIRRMCAIKVAASVIGQFAQTREEEVRTEHIFPLAEHPRLARTGAAAVTTNDSVERIRKLMRLAEGAGVTEAEAASALERANALLIRHNLTLDRITASTSSARAQAVTEHRIRTGWSGNWRATLTYVLAKHNLCEPFSSLVGRVESVVVVGRPANVQAMHATFDWIAAQLERFAQAEWLAFDAAQRRGIAEFPETPWCRECEDWPLEDETYRADGVLYCAECDTAMLAERPVVRAFAWKTAFYRGRPVAHQIPPL